MATSAFEDQHCPAGRRGQSRAMSFPFPRPARLCRAAERISAFGELCLSRSASGATVQPASASSANQIPNTAVSQHLPLGERWGLAVPYRSTPFQPLPLPMSRALLPLSGTWIPGTRDPLASSLLPKSSINVRRSDREANQCRLWQAPSAHLALPTTNPWHKVPREQVLYIFQLYNEAADSFN